MTEGKLIAFEDYIQGLLALSKQVRFTKTRVAHLKDGKHRENAEEELKRLKEELISEINKSSIYFEPIIK